MALRIMRGLFCVIAILLLTGGAFAQTRVTGKILDAKTKEPLPFVNVIFKGTKNGATSDFDGNYDISTNAVSDSVVATFVGYKSTTVGIRRNVSQNITILLEENAINLQVVEVKAGENPAHRILRKVIAHKPKNDRDLLDAYQYESYNKLEFDLNNINKEFKNRKIMKPIKFIFDNIDSTNRSEKPFLPLFITETLSDYYYRRDPKEKKEVVKASKISGVQNSSISQFLGDMYLNLNVYENSIILFSKGFASPVSDNGLFFYKYYLIDSMYVDNHWCYQIQFKPKRKQEFCFEGNMWIADTTFAIKRLEMSIANDANINFINGLSVIQDYERVDSVWMLHKDKLVIDFSVKDNTMGIYGRKTTSYKNFVINKPHFGDFYSDATNLVVDDEALKRNDDYWNGVRHDTLTKNEKAIYKMVDTIQTLPIYKTWVDIVTIFISGYKTFNYFDIGPYYNLASFNGIEGWRLRFGGRTSIAFSEWYELNGYVAYGIKDKQFKYSMGYKTFLSKKPRIIAGVSYKNDYEVLGQSATAFSQDNILSSVFRARSLKNMTAIEKTEAFYEQEWYPGFSNKLLFTNRIFSQILGDKYLFNTLNSKLDEREFINASEFSLVTRYARDEKFVGDGFTRTSLGTRSPVLTFQYTYGGSGIFGGEYDYHRMVASIDDRLYFTPFGFIHPGNETYIYDYSSYNLMNFFEFVSDRYITISIFHHFDGFFFNRIPLFRKLKWREVFIAKGLLGHLNPKNLDVTVLPNGLSWLDKGAYAEVGAGVENIAKIFRFDAFWRLTYLDKPDISKFGIRGSIQLSF
ncbi:MAG: carboxypeptidase-like regulatory domain-containing protein [Bacteroidetes bacterium]|nr:carboxypeptidase-like regulatory domain-containing protein [Bacteroidota bacterium]